MQLRAVTEQADMNRLLTHEAPLQEVDDCCLRHIKGQVADAVTITLISQRQMALIHGVALTAGNVAIE